MLTEETSINKLELGMSKCCCPPNHDARTCFELRHYGYSPSDKNVYDDKCECACHYEDPDDESAYL